MPRPVPSQQELSQSGAGGYEWRGFAAPVTLPAPPAMPTAWPPLLVTPPGDLSDIGYSPAALSRSLVAAGTPQGESAPSDRNASHVVVGYLRTAVPPVDAVAALQPAPDDLDDAATAPLVAAIAQYARERGLTLLRVHRDDVTDDDARRPGFSACLRHLYLREASAIVVPTWDHLAPNEVLRRALCRNATSAGGTIQVIDPTAG
jgi:hypothetical protein